jgi:hypothetical protein
MVGVIFFINLKWSLLITQASDFLYLYRRIKFQQVLVAGIAVGDAAHHPQRLAAMHAAVQVLARFTWRHLRHQGRERISCAD